MKVMQKYRVPTPARSGGSDAPSETCGMEVDYELISEWARCAGARAPKIENNDNEEPPPAVDAETEMNATNNAFMVIRK